jgi:hypothetical membrane protein
MGYYWGMNASPKKYSLRLILGSIAWILCGQYFLVEVYVSRAWTASAYNFRYNTISDLGATVCPYVFPGTALVVCSPLHMLMNDMFIINGLLIIFGSLLLRPLFPIGKKTTSALVALSIGALGLIGVGLFPENVNVPIHLSSAGWFFAITNISLLALAVDMYKRKPLLALYTFVSGAVAIIALVILVVGPPHSWGNGFVERIVGDPFTIWLVVVGFTILFRSLRTATHELFTLSSLPTS